MPRLQSDGIRAISFWAMAFFIGLISVPSFGSGAEVLIYYSNETSAEGIEAANYATILDWLRSTDDASHRRIADQLERDTRIFRTAVDVEIDEIATELPRIKSGPQAIVFTNRLVRSGRCLVWKHDWTSFREIPFSAAVDENYILAANPLSRRDTFETALAIAAKQFNPTQYEFVLVTKSHGSQSKAITPRLIVRVEETNREELLDVAAQSRGEIEHPAWAGKLGISKADYFAVLSHALESFGMRFPLVFMESCHSLSDEVTPDRLPSNVERLLVIREHANYNNVLWSDLLQGLSNNRRLSDALASNLSSKFVLITATDFGRPAAKRSSGQLVPLWIYFAPLAFWAIWVSWQWQRRKVHSRVA